MPDISLSSTEKTKLTDFAREVVARNARAGAAKQEPAAREAEPADAYSPDGLRRRLTALEQDFAALERRVEQSFSAILTTMQRIEARTSQTSGELAAVRDDLDSRSGDAAYMRDEMMAAAKDYGTKLNGEISRLVERIDSMSDATDETEPSKSPATAAKPTPASSKPTAGTPSKGTPSTPPKTPGARRNG